MMRVVNPPEVASRSSWDEDLLFKYFIEVRDRGLPYLHYDELRHRFKIKKERDSLWAAMKLSRLLSSMFLLPGEDDSVLSQAHINSTAIIQKSCSIVDRLTSSAAETERYEKLDAADYLMDELTVAESIASSQLEGAVTTSRVALEMLKVGRKPRDEGEKMIMGNYRMMKYVSERGNDPFNIDELLKLHRVAIENINDEKYSPGQFRIETDDVVVADHEGNIVYTPPSAGQLPDALEKLFEFINLPHETAEDEKYLHPLVKACVIHFMIGYLHPFKDGNGRTARALFYWYMLKCGYTAFRYISISKLLKNAPAKYVRAYLYSETDDMDLTYFVNYQCEIVTRAVQDYIDYIKSIVQTRVELKQWLFDSGIFGRINARQRDLATIAINQPGVLFTASEVSSRMAVSENTAREDLKKLTALGLMKAMKEGKGNVYLSPRSLYELKKWHGKKDKRPSTQDW
ncbi:Fic family protein [Cronobacter dublinensis]|uniref:Fic family protein n=2 Tax=Cronobacter dublinensis TaxID=413497 RepID=UPI001319C116|nr:Fic family protein [Cronobacter dublinensis]